MPQLDFYSYIYQLSFIFLVSIIIYVYLIQIVLPTISITLKLRAYIIDTKVNNINNIIDKTINLQSQIVSIIDLIIKMLLTLSESFKDDLLAKEVFYILGSGKELNGIIENDLLEELLLQSYKVALIESCVDVIVDLDAIKDVFPIND